MVVIAWIAVNAIAVTARWDPYPFILLNLAFSTQAAYAAPLILLAETRQAERDRIRGEHESVKHEQLTKDAEARVELIKRETDELRQLLESNTELTRQDKELTQQVAELTQKIHTLVSAR